MASPYILVELHTILVVWVSSSEELVSHLDMLLSISILNLGGVMMKLLEIFSKQGEMFCFSIFSETSDWS